MRKHIMGLYLFDVFRFRIAVQIDRQRLTDACNNVDGDVRRKRQLAANAVYIPKEVLQPAMLANTDDTDQVSFVCEGCLKKLYIRSVAASIFLVLSYAYTRTLGFKMVMVIY